MNQPNLSVMTHRPTPAAESPDVLAMVRRYAWLLIAGAVLGGATASGIFVYQHALSFGIHPPTCHSRCCRSSAPDWGAGLLLQRGAR